MTRCHRPLRFLLAAFTLPALLLAAACSPDSSRRSSGSSDPAERELVVSQGSDILTLDPYKMLESPTFSLQRNVFDPLTDTDAENRLVPCLAESWEHLSENEWRFHLRAGVRFHNGNPFTAADVLFSLERAIQWPESRVKSEVQTVARVEKIDDHTVAIHTRIPDAILPLRLASILILDAETCRPAIAEHGEAWLATHAIGTGPYRVVEWLREQHCLIEATDTWWGGPAPEVRRIRCLAVSEDASRIMALRRGDIDILVNLPPRHVAAIRALPNHRIVENAGLRLIYLGLDTGRERTPGGSGMPNPLRDRRVREAILLAIDNRLIIDKIMGGLALPADQLFPEGITGYDPSITLDRPAPDRARVLLASAGYPDGFSIRLDGPNDRYINDEQILQAVAVQLARIGIRVEVSARPKAQFFELEKAGDSSFFLIGWANTNGDGAGTLDHLLHTPDPARSLGDSNNSTNYSNARIDELTELASRAFDPAERNRLLQEANRVATNDLVHIPLHFQADLYVVSDRIQWTPRRETQVRGTDIKWK